MGQDASVVVGIAVRALGIERAVEHREIVFVEAVEMGDTGVELADQIGLGLGVAYGADRNPDRVSPVWARAAKNR